MWKRMTTDEVIFFAFKFVKKMSLDKHYDYKWSGKIWRKSSRNN